MNLSKHMGLLGEISEGILYVWGFVLTRYFYLLSISQGWSSVIREEAPLMIIAQVFTIIVAVTRLFVMWPKIKERFRRIVRRVLRK